MAEEIADRFAFGELAPLRDAGRRDRIGEAEKVADPVLRRGKACAACVFSTSAAALGCSHGAINLGASGRRRRSRSNSVAAAPQFGQVAAGKSWHAGATASGHARGPLEFDAVYSWGVAPHGCHAADRATLRFVPLFRCFSPLRADVLRLLALGEALLCPLSAVVSSACARSTSTLLLRFSCLAKPVKARYRSPGHGLGA
jgi:hypothetical protein